MEPIQRAVNRAAEAIRQNSTQSSSGNMPSAPNTREPNGNASVAKPREAYNCWVCKDLGWLYEVDAKGEVIWFNGPKIVRCRCQSGLDIERRRRHLLSIDGLNP